MKSSLNVFESLSSNETRLFAVVHRFDPNEAKLLKWKNYWGFFEHLYHVYSINMRLFALRGIFIVTREFERGEGEIASGNNRVLLMQFIVHNHDRIISLNSKSLDG